MSSSTLESGPNKDRLEKFKLQILTHTEDGFKIGGPVEKKYRWMEDDLIMCSVASKRSAKGWRNILRRRKKKNLKQGFLAKLQRNRRPNQGKDNFFKHLQKKLKISRKPAKKLKKRCARNQTGFKWSTEKEITETFVVSFIFTTDDDADCVGCPFLVWELN